MDRRDRRWWGWVQSGSASLGGRDTDDALQLVYSLRDKVTETTEYPERYQAELKALNEHAHQFEKMIGALATRILVDASTNQEPSKEAPSG